MIISLHDTKTPISLSVNLYHDVSYKVQIRTDISGYLFPFTSLFISFTFLATMFANSSQTRSTRKNSYINYLLIISAMYWIDPMKIITYSKLAALHDIRKSWTGQKNPNGRCIWKTYNTVWQVETALLIMQLPQSNQE